MNEQTDLSPVPPSQLKSNMISLDCHFSQYATICQQLQAEVRSPPGARRQGALAWEQESKRQEHWGVAEALFPLPTSFAHLRLLGAGYFGSRWPP